VGKRFSWRGRSGNKKRERERSADDEHDLQENPSIKKKNYRREEGGAKSRKKKEKTSRGSERGEKNRLKIKKKKMHAPH